MALTAKQQRFCEEYSIDFNATQAAIRAGYSKKTAGSIGDENLRKPEIQKYLFALKAEKKQANDLTAQKVIDELAKLAFHNVQDFVNGGNSILELKFIDPEKAAAVSGIKTTARMYKGVGGKLETEVQTSLKFHSKERALELLGKHFGIFEMDNSQKKPVINLGNLSSEQLIQFEKLLSAATGHSQ